MESRPHVLTVLVGDVRPLGADGTPSAIAKAPVEGPRRVGALGVAGDAQADLRVHGGVDKAVHAYPWAHYAAWREELPGHRLLDAPGAFGENLSVEGVDETEVCFGDRWRIGTAVMEVSQGRQPCHKLALRFGVPDMPARVTRSLLAGWYFRVLEPGEVAAGDEMTVLERPYPSHSVADVLAVIRDRDADDDRLRAVLELPLPPRWRQMFERRLARHPAAS